MAGRYGGDQLSMALLIVSVLLTLIGGAAKLPALSIIGYIPLGFSVFRTFSKNLQRRSMENYKFSMLVSPVYAWFKKTQRHLLESKNHKFLKCPECKAQLRLPKGKGSMLVTCPKCHAEFKARS